MYKFIIFLVIISFLLQIGCGSITQIPYPVDESKSDSDIRSLNYFGERLNSTIQFTNSIEVEAYWLKMQDDKIYFLTEGLDDTTSVTVEKIKTVRFYDVYGGCMKGGLLGTGFFLLPAIAFGSSSSQKSPNEYGALVALVAFVGSVGIGIISGMLFFGNREFNIVQYK